MILFKVLKGYSSLLLCGNSVGGEQETWEMVWRWMKGVFVCVCVLPSDIGYH